MSAIFLAILASSRQSAPAPVCIVEPAAQVKLKRVLGLNRSFVFCQIGSQSIRRVDNFHEAWLDQLGRPHLKTTCRPGQFITFQIGVFARQRVQNINVTFSNFKGSNGKIAADQARCISLSGLDMNGVPFNKSLQIEAGHLQPLWCGIDVPSKASGTYQGLAKVKLGPGQTETVPIQISVSGPQVLDHGAEDPNTLSRLRWLDSTAGEGKSITKPFVEMKVHGRTISFLGRDLVLAESGLPKQIVSHFSASNTRIVSAGKAILAGPIEFGSMASSLKALTGQISSIKAGKTDVNWTCKGSLGDLKSVVRGKVDFTGSGQLEIQLTATKDTEFQDLYLDVPFTKASSTFMMGINRPGGLRPATHQWTWDIKRHQDCFWIGDVNAGLMIRLKDTDFHRPLLNIYYSFLPLSLPNSWGNGGNGGVNISEQGNVALARAFSGRRHLRKGEVLNFIADFYVTPFRTIDTEKQWSTRFIHPHSSRDPRPLDDAVKMANEKSGPNVINVHQATYYNPYINYPYSADSFDSFINIVERAHEKGVRARVYYTTREITQNMPELYALHSLNGEVVFPGPGKDAKTLINPNGPSPWLVKNLGTDFVPAWVDHVGGKYAEDDISVITTPDSRWNNFYLEGLKWMVDRAKIDGVYIDDTALDASSLRRARRILSVRPNPIIDLHTWNHFNEYAGYANNLNMYMEVLPYLDRLWLGEGFNASAASWDFWLVEMSGLPFGIMSEMLDSPHPGRGLLFGETGRLGWSGDPRPVWSIFDQFGIKETEMIPFFDPNCPIITNDQNVKTTVFRGKDHAIISMASWSAEEADIVLHIDWHKLGLDPNKCEITVPKVSGFQSEQAVEGGNRIKIKPNTGIVILIRSRAKT